MKSNNVTVDSSGNADSSFSTFYNWVTQTDIVAHTTMKQVNNVSQYHKK